MFKRKPKESLTGLKIWSNHEFNKREKKLKQLINKVKEIKYMYSHFGNGDKIQKIENQINNILCYMDQPFTAKEIIDALAQMCPTKALGPDGLPVVFLSETLEFSQ